MSSGNFIHLGGTRIRIVSGSGNLIVTYSDINSTSYSQTSYTMISQAEPFILANLVTQKAKLRIEVDNIDETFQISRIIIYYKPLWTMAPQ